MGWLRKISHVFLVVAVAALMSVPFKRVPPQQMTKSAGRGEWQLVKPRLQFKQLIKPVQPASPPGNESVGEQTPKTVADESGKPERETPKSPVAPAIGRPIPVDDPPAIRDQEAYPTAPLSRLPRIETQPAPPDRFNNEAAPPNLPSEFNPLGETPTPTPTSPTPTSPTPDSAPNGTSP